MTKARAQVESMTAGTAMVVAGKAAIRIMAAVMAAAILASCSREKIDWKSAEAADTVEAYDHFIERHPDSDLATRARARVAQLDEDREWKRASATDTAEGYRQFLAQHESGKWAEEARIRIENFALDGTATGPASPTLDAEPVMSQAAVREHPTSAPVADATPSAQKPARADAPVVATPRPAPVGDAPSGTPPAGLAASGQFGIQLGAFRTREAALDDWKRLQVKYDADLHGLLARAVPVQQSGGQLFRLQAPVGEEARSRAICASLAKQAQPCVVVLPPSR